MPRKKGSEKTGGRKKGTPNKINKQTKEVISDLVEGLTEQVIRDIADLEPRDRIAVWIKLTEYILPKPQRVDVTLTGNQNVSIAETLKHLAETNEK